MQTAMGWDVDPRSGLAQPICPATHFKKGLDSPFLYWGQPGGVCPCPECPTEVGEVDCEDLLESEVPHRDREACQFPF